MIDTTKEVIKIKLTSPTGEVKETKVYTKFTSDARARTVQAICDLVGGSVVYFRFKSTSKKSYTTVPVHDRRSLSMTGSYNNSSGNLSVLETVLNPRESFMTVFGESRVEWTLATESSDETGTELDYGPEHSEDTSSGNKDGNLDTEFF